MFLVCVFFFLFLSIVAQLPEENLKQKFLFLRFDGKIPHRGSSNAWRSRGNRPGWAASKRGLLWNLRGPWDRRGSPTAPAAHFANWLRVRAELRDPGGGGWGEMSTVFCASDANGCEMNAAAKSPSAISPFFTRCCLPLWRTVRSCEQSKDWIRSSVVYR